MLQAITISGAKMVLSETNDQRISLQDTQAAFAQMTAERSLELVQAAEVAKWLSTQLNGTSTRHYPLNDRRALSPDPDLYVIYVTHQTYGPSVKDLCNLLITVSGIRLLEAASDSEAINKASTEKLSQDFFELDISGYPQFSAHTQKVFKGRFEYFDNHWAGF